MYNKIFTKILDSSIWLESTPTRIVWLMFIAVMDEAGFAQFASVRNVAHRARVTDDEAQAAITALEGPDPDSSDPDQDGRRIERVPGGWIVLNAEKYRELVTRSVIQEQTRERVRRHRAKTRGVTNSNAPVTPSDTDTDTRVPTPIEVFDPDVQKRKDAKKNKGKHRGHTYCGDYFCVDAEKHGRFEKRLRAVGADIAQIDLKAMYVTWDKDFGTAGSADHPAFFLEKRFAATLKDEFGEGA